MPALRLRRRANSPQSCVFLPGTRLMHLECFIGVGVATWFGVVAAAYFAGLSRVSTG